MLLENISNDENKFNVFKFICESMYNLNEVTTHNN